MKELSLNAKECLDNYLKKVKARLRGAKSLDANEIERDINEHIERALESEVEPVGYEAVAGVLDRLGSPEQWVPDEELSWWRKIIGRMQNGPDDWRLAYICFGIFVLGILIFPFGRSSILLWIIFFLPLSFYIARSTLSVAGGPEELGAQKKLIYPPLVVVYFIIGLAVLLWTVPVILGVADGLEHELRGEHKVDAYTTRIRFDKGTYWFLAGIVVLAFTGLWWIILSIILRSRRLVNWLIYPFGEIITRRKLKTLLVAGILITAAGIVGCLLFTA
jgi:hypothetical protein